MCGTPDTLIDALSKRKDLRNLTAVSTLALRPHLAALVRSFSITIDDGAEKTEPGYYDRLKQAVQGMSGLTSLEIHIDASLSWVMLSSPLVRDVPLYPRLEHFACSFGLDSHIAGFLAHTPSLTSLQLASSTDFVELPTSIIPSLATYTGPCTLLAQLLPSRPVTSLHLSGDLSLTDIELFAETIGAPSSAVSDVCPVSRRTEDGDIPSKATAACPV